MAFFIKRDNHINGPLTADQIKSGVASGKIKEMDLISSSKEGPWASLAPAVAKARTQPEEKIAVPSMPPLSSSGEEEIQLAPLEESFKTVNMARQRPATGPRPVTAQVPVSSPVSTGVHGNPWKLPIIAGVVTLFLACVAVLGLWHLAGSRRLAEKALEDRILLEEMEQQTTVGQSADPAIAVQQERELEDSLRLFASVVVPASQDFLDNTPLVRLFREETVTLKMSVHIKMLDSYDVDVLAAGAFAEGVINTRIESILDSDPLGRKNIKMGSTQTVPLNCKYRDGVWELEGDTLGELISGLERAGGFNNPDEEFRARMDRFDRQIKSLSNPTGL